MSYLKNLDSRLSNFFDTPVKNFNKAGFAKRNIHQAGYYANKATYSVSNTVGDYMVRSASKAEKAITASQKAGFFGKLIYKSKFLTKIANGLSTLGKAGGAKLPGTGTVIAVASAFFGVGKAIYHYAKGETDKGHHQLVQTAFSTIGLLGGLALTATPIGFPIALLMAVGSGFIMDSIGEKVADKLFPNAKESKKEELHNNPNNSPTKEFGHNSETAEENNSNDPLYNLTGVHLNSPFEEVDQNKFNTSMKNLDNEIKDLEEFANSLEKH